MRNDMKKVILYALLIAGVVLVGAGVYLTFALPDSITTETISTTVIFPEDSPVLAMEDKQLGLDINRRIHIYKDGIVIEAISRPGMNSDIGPVAVTRQWTLDETEMASLLAIFKNRYSELAGSYVFPELKGNDKDLAKIDQEITLFINIDGIVKEVKGQGYYLAYSSYIGPHRDIPDPLNELYQALNNVSSDYEKEYVQAVHDAHTNADDVMEITNYRTGDKVTLKNDDHRFDEIHTFLLNAVVQNVTHKTGTTSVNGQTSTVSITIPYAIGYVITCKPDDTTEIKFTYSGTIWYESEDNIYQVISTTTLGNLLDEIIR
jgi:hypothetical protein